VRREARLLDADSRNIVYEVGEETCRVGRVEDVEEVDVDGEPVRDDRHEDDLKGIASPLIAKTGRRDVTRKK
jgi:hypothetical protein